MKFNITVDLEDMLDYNYLKDFDVKGMVAEQVGEMLRDQIRSDLRKRLKRDVQRWAADYAKGKLGPAPEDGAIHLTIPLEVING